MKPIPDYSWKEHPALISMPFTHYQLDVIGHEERCKYVFLAQRGWSPVRCEFRSHRNHDDSFASVLWTKRPMIKQMTDDAVAYEHSIDDEVEGRIKERETEWSKDMQVIRNTNKAPQRVIKMDDVLEVKAKVVTFSDEIVDAVKKLSAVSEALTNSGLTERMVLLMLTDITGLNKSQIKKVLQGLEELEKAYLKPKPVSEVQKDFAVEECAIEDDLMANRKRNPRRAKQVWDNNV